MASRYLGRRLVNRGGTYKMLAARLEELRGEGYDSLLTRVGRAATSETVWIDGEPVVVDIAVDWADKKPGTLRVSATAYGPSTWMMERIDESFIIGPAAVGLQTLE
jgi:hypothetical protein